MNNNDFVIENGVLTKYNGKDKDVVIPEGVKEIGDNAFERRTALKKVTIPEGVTRIGYLAFNNCKSLEEVIIPDSVCAIGNSAFRNCRGLTRIKLPQKVTHISNGTFWGCSELREVMIPDGVFEIGIAAFSGCEKLTNITFPQRLSAWWWDVLKGCSSLQCLTLMGDCENWEKETLPEQTIVIAPSTFLKFYNADMKHRLVHGFAAAAERGIEYSQEHREEYLGYIKSQRKKLYPSAVKNPNLMKLMLSEKIVPSADIEIVLKLAQDEKNSEIIAMLENYQQNNKKR